MAELYYTVDPIDVEGGGFTIEGLQTVLDKVRETWGGREFKAASVSPALSLGRGACVLGVEAGRVLLIRDDAARQMAKARELAEQEPDGRVKPFYGEATIARVVGPNRAEFVDKRELQGDGLMGLFFNAAMYVQEQLGECPQCMDQETCEMREPGVRAQLSRAKSQSRDATVIHFPGNKTAAFFELPNRPGEYYQVSLMLRTERPQSLDEKFAAPRRE